MVPQHIWGLPKIGNPNIVPPNSRIDITRTPNFRKLPFIVEPHPAAVTSGLLPRPTAPTPVRLSFGMLNCVHFVRSGRGRQKLRKPASRADCGLNSKPRSSTSEELRALYDPKPLNPTPSTQAACILHQERSAPIPRLLEQWILIIKVLCQRWLRG